MMQYRKIFIIRLISAVCTVAVLLASLPHHHHNGSPAVCFNITHCWNGNTHDCGAHDPDGHSCTDHPHDCGDNSSEPAGCHLKIDVAEILKQDVKIFQVLTAALPDISDYRTVKDDILSGIRYYNIAPPVQILLTDYISSVLLPRAPSFLS